MFRFMRLFVFFDLPVDTSADRKHYRAFRKHLIKNGFLMLQQSVYVKLLLNDAQAKSVIEKIKAKKPTKGMVQIPKVTERQFLNMESIVDEQKTEVMGTDQRTVIL